jgi:hypothetical protein
VFRSLAIDARMDVFETMVVHVYCSFCYLVGTFASGFLIVNLPCAGFLFWACAGHASLNFISRWRLC